MPDKTKDTTNAGATDAKAATDQAADAARTATDQMRDGAGTARGAFTDTVVDPARRAGEAMKASGQKMAEGGSTISVKMIDQAEQNTREAFAAFREAASAKDLAQVMKIQGDYMREQGNRSMAQAREIGEMILQFGRDAVQPLKR